MYDKEDNKLRINSVYEKERDDIEARKMAEILFRFLVDTMYPMDTFCYDHSLDYQRILAQLMVVVRYYNIKESELRAIANFRELLGNKYRRLSRKEETNEQSTVE
jgi:hypothetical protein